MLEEFALFIRVNLLTEFVNPQLQFDTVTGCGLWRFDLKALTAVGYVQPWNFSKTLQYQDE
jgi:hypothetical protein